MAFENSYLRLEINYKLAFW